MQSSLSNLRTTVQHISSNFNGSNCYGIANSTELLQKLDSWEEVIIERLEYCDHFLAFFNQIDYAHLQRSSQYYNQHCQIQNAGHSISFRGMHECRFYLHLLIDGYFFNLASAFDIFALICNVLLFNITKRPDFSKLADLCLNSSDAFEAHIANNYYYKNNPIIRNNTWINDFKHLRNDLTHDHLFFPQHGKLQLRTNQIGQEIYSYIGIDQHYIQNLGLTLATNDLDIYIQNLLSKARTFFSDGIVIVDKSVKAANCIPRY